MSATIRRSLTRALTYALAALIIATGLTLSPATSVDAHALSRQKATRVLKVAASERGTPYVYGGTSPRGFDCSGYTRWVFRKVGKRLPRVSHDQYRATRQISRSNARRGDLVFFHSGSKRGRVYHVGIYAGKGQIWHAPSTGKRVHKARIWTQRAVTYGRVR